jgi:hypothetical protein
MNTSEWRTLIRKLQKHFPVQGTVTVRRRHASAVLPNRPRAATRPLLASMLRRVGVDASAASGSRLSRVSAATLERRAMSAKFQPSPRIARN